MLVAVAAAGAAIAAPAAVQVAVDNSRGGCAVVGGFEVQAPPGVAWDVLHDYDHIPRFVRSMVSSRAERRSDGRLFVSQVARAGFFLFRRSVHVELLIDEEPLVRIGFHDVLGRDFRDYQGEWRIEAGSAVTRVRYAHEAEPRAALPRSMCRGVLQHTARDLLEQVRAEILRRAHGVDPPRSP